MDAVMALKHAAWRALLLFWSRIFTACKIREALISRIFPGIPRQCRHGYGITGHQSERFPLRPKFQNWFTTLTLLCHLPYCFVLWGWSKLQFMTWVIWHVVIFAVRPKEMIFSHRFKVILSISELTRKTFIEGPLTFVLAYAEFFPSWSLPL